MKDYRTKLITQIKREYDRYQYLLEENTSNNSATSIKLGRVSGLIAALNILENADYTVNDCLDLCEELTK